MMKVKKFDIDPELKKKSNDKAVTTDDIQVKIKQREKTDREKKPK